MRARLRSWAKDAMLFGGVALIGVVGILAVTSFTFNTTVKDQIEAELKIVDDQTETTDYYFVTKGRRKGQIGPSYLALTTPPAELKKSGILDGYFMRRTCRTYTNNGKFDGSENMDVQVCENVRITVEEAQEGVQNSLVPGVIG